MAEQQQTIHDFEWRELVGTKGPELARQILISRGLRQPGMPTIDLTDKPSLDRLRDMLAVVRDHRRKLFLVEANAVRKYRAKLAAA